MADIPALTVKHHLHSSGMLSDSQGTPYMGKASSVNSQKEEISSWAKPFGVPSSHSGSSGSESYGGRPSKDGVSTGADSVGALAGFDDVGGCKDVSPRGSTDGEFCGGEEGGNSMELSPRDSIFKCLKDRNGGRELELQPASYFFDRIRAVLPAHTRDDPKLTSEFEHLQNMLDYLIMECRDRPGEYKIRMISCELKLDEMHRQAEDLSRRILRKSGKFHPKGLIEYVEDKFARSNNLNEDLSRKNKWTAMLNANKKLRDAFSADFVDLTEIAQVAAETYDELQKFSFERLGPLRGIPVPLELQKECQHKFLKDLCGFLYVRPLLMFVNHPCNFYRDSDDDDEPIIETA